MNCWLGEVIEGRGALSEAGQLPLRADTGLAGVSLLCLPQTQTDVCTECAHFKQATHCRAFTLDWLGVLLRGGTLGQ
jgi:hypothetical protein